MRAFFSILGLGAWVASAQAYTFDDTGASDALAAQALQNFMTYQYDNASNAAASCPQDQIIRRREWNSLSVEEREAYVQANVCMFTSPNKGTVAPGARTRWDDFCVTHQQQALYIHNVGNFFAWHRWYIIAWETALRDECGYTGYLPYLDWAKIASDPIGAPIFDGSNSSISSNGVYLQHNENLGQVPGNPLVFPTGSGGGCVEDGPFANRTINLGPRDALDYNPRCMSRDILQVVSSEAMTDAKTAQVINDNDNIVDFQNNFQFVGAQGDFANWGIHASGHNMISGTPGGDFWISAAVSTSGARCARPFGDP